MGFSGELMQNMVRLERWKPQLFCDMPSLGRMGKRFGKRRGLGKADDRHMEQTDRNRRLSKEVLSFCAMRSSKSFGS